MATTTSQDFTTYYLQRTTQEFAEDLDKVRAADDFKAESLPFLIHALQQGTALYSARDQERVVKPASAAAAVDEDVEMVEAAEEDAAPKKEKKEKKDKKEKSKKRKSTSG
ncbi:hypothetical protein CPAR01_16133 [Colletotrichum paranaense]|uniref:Ribosome assembly protein 3 n=4 Tax=Colletotrichum acutatum species complex TaxID=2707335 RepID=A0A9Q8T0U1_9PEZI|nr:uncharacterized protein CLUP02_12608 [Colletotrichum lupini]XP_060340859.1 uncharacterized protein CPAR01_16133 [Colletotrichum paranaense]XP_060379506.1 uncharacterized protein CTAM01_09804 [Colletotrichum tamarilloi]KAK0374858.1 hypothetical protein CLIM01_07765 [Colletotrichum limetticola]KAK1492606.1 hypothetical protein CTAM01_09804 [Colletotrichum tamarilloi]KAK1517269.1 hypothetical protein CPAR01_16133 [Colletotrichum paranaense]UQC87106.1 hypothetical protein CLUP02_12608 [Colleto